MPKYFGQVSKSTLKYHMWNITHVFFDMPKAANLVLQFLQWNKNIFSFVEYIFFAPV